MASKLWAVGKRDAAKKTFQAGCRRTWELAAQEAELAYTALAFPECPTCPHRVEPEGGPPFCTLRPMATPHPFAGLAGLREGLND